MHQDVGHAHVQRARPLNEPATTATQGTASSPEVFSELVSRERIRTSSLSIEQAAS